MKYPTLLVLATLLGSLLACNSGRHSPAGFRLPENGDVERGQQAFVELECHRCHTVADVELPAPANDEKVVPLGGTVYEVRTDGYLVTSIIHPSHKFARRVPKEQTTVEGESRMPDYTRTMTVRQLIDVVAFLQSRYKVAPPPYMHP